MPNPTAGSFTRIDMTTGPINMNNNFLQNLKDPVDPADGANKKYVDAQKAGGLKSGRNLEIFNNVISVSDDLNVKTLTVTKIVNDQYCDKAYADNAAKISGIGNIVVSGRSISLKDDVAIKTLTLDKLTVKDPKDASDPITKGYFESRQLTAGDGLDITNSTISVKANPNACTTAYVDGAVKISGIGNIIVTDRSISLKDDVSIKSLTVDKITVQSPKDATDPVTKSYFEANQLTAGDGLKLENSVISLKSDPNLATTSYVDTALKKQKPVFAYITSFTDNSIDIGGSEFVILNPSAGLDQLAINFPLDPLDGRYVRIKTTEQITNLTFNDIPLGPNQEFPPSLDVDEVIHYIYISAASAWYRY